MNNFDFSKIKFVEGHSLGEYSALVASDALSLEDAVSLVNKRGKLIDTLKSRSLEFKIFLKNNEKKLILENLSNQYDINLDDLLPYINNFSPGVIIKSIDCLNQLEIKVKDSLYDSSNILLDMFKKTKNDFYLETIKFLTDVHFNYFILNLILTNININ